MATLSGNLARRLNKWVPAALLRPFSHPAALFFHGVEHEIADPEMQEMHHAVESFRGIAKALRDNFQVLPLNAIDDVLAHPEKHRRSVFLMSDDGYRNTLTTAADILEEAGLPWTLFISTHHIATGERNPIHLARLFSRHARAGVYKIPYFSEPITLGRNNERAKVSEVLIGRLKMLDHAQAKEAITTLMQNIPETESKALHARYESESFLNWGEVAALKARGVEIGAHAHWHWPMNDYQQEVDIEKQAQLSRALILEKLGECRSFAYPFGTPRDISKKAWRYVRAAGYSHAFSTVAGTLNASKNPWLLPRYGLALSEPNIAAMAALLSGNNRRMRKWQTDMAQG